MVSLFPSRAVALVVGPLSVHWYGLMYALAFLLGAFLLPYLLRFRSLSLSSRDRESLLMHLFLGVVVGGRVGYVLFYGLSYFLAHPLSVFAVWEGGMSSHGGFVGVTIALLLFSRKHRIHPLALADVLMVPIALGLALGRLGNFINGELYGTLTTVPWAMYFPGVDGLRHPTQIYAILKDLCIASVIFLHLRSTVQNPIVGRTTSYFLMTYALLRSLVEVYRDQPFGFVDKGIVSLSYGQIYTIPVVILGIILWLYSGTLHRRQTA